MFLLCYTIIMMCYLSGLHQSACINLNLVQRNSWIATNPAEHYEKKQQRKKKQSVWNKIFCPCWNTWKYSNCTTKVHSAGDSGCKWHLWPADGAADQLGPQEDHYWRQMPQESHSFDKGCYRFCFRVFWGKNILCFWWLLLVMSWNV